MAVKKDHIRNFSIIAHIDHGKSTLADRLLELTQSVAIRDMTEQLLDDMDLERERGITIKAHAVKLNYTAKDGEEYELNLIDTPGHVDFNYEVSRSLAACEGALLIVDASQGVEAQTLANTYLALDHDLEIVPIINKIDLPAADPDRVAEEVEEVIGLDCSDAPRVSAKTGENVEAVLEKIVSDIPAPLDSDDSKPLRALVFDSVYDNYKGVIVYVRVVDGKIKAGDTMRMMATGAEFTVVEVGYMRATSMEPAAELTSGEVGYITASIKTVGDARVGDTVTTAEYPAEEALPGYRKVNPMVFYTVLLHQARILRRSHFHVEEYCSVSQGKERVLPRTRLLHRDICRSPQAFLCLFCCRVLLQASEGVFRSPCHKDCRCRQVCRFRFLENPLATSDRQCFLSPLPFRSCLSLPALRRQS